VSNDVAGLQKGAQTLDHIFGYIPNDRREKDLHEGLGIIPCPLLEAAAMRESAEAWESRYCSDSLSQLVVKQASSTTRDTPSINIIQYDIAPSFTIPFEDIGTYPIHQMVLEYTLDNLM
jgi:hypothetical protein